MSTPNPTIMQKFAPTFIKPDFKKPDPEPIVAELDLSQPGLIVRPGLRPEGYDVEHDGVVKAKHLKSGQIVQSWLHGEPKGARKTVATVTPSEDGSMVTVTFSSKHPDMTVKAAYRYYDSALKGTTVRRVRQVPALVAYEEV